MMTKAPTKKNDPLSVGKHDGSQIFGYEVHKDGTISLSPHHTDKIRQAVNREQGLDFLLKAVTKYVVSEAEECAKSKGQFWSEFRNDTNAPGEWVFDYSTGRIKPAAKPIDDN